MFGDDVRQAKAAAILRMNVILDSLEPTEAPGWLIWIMVIPILVFYTVGTVVRAIVAMLAMMLFNLLKAAVAPILCLALVIDLTLMMGWFFKQVVNKIKGDGR